MERMDVKQIVEAALARLDVWIVGEDFKGYEPHDARKSPVLKHLCGTNRLLGIAFLQLFRRCPINFRPFLRIPKNNNAKAFGLFLSTYSKKYQRSRAQQDLDQVSFFSQWLQNNISPGYAGACWGYPFPWPNRASFVQTGTPTAVNTAFIVFGLLDCYVRCGDDDALKTAQSACNFFLENLNRLETEDGVCFSYTPYDRRFVHNASVLVGTALARTGHVSGEETLSDWGKRTIDFTVSRQADDGSWPYGEGHSEKWVDNFHTGFVLNALTDFDQCASTVAVGAATQKGYGYYKDNFFLQKTIPKYYFNKLYPVDVHAVAQSILTLLKHRHIDGEAVTVASNIAVWAIEHMQHETGFFYYQKHRFFKNRIPYMRWGQAWMQYAFVELLDALALERA